MPNLREYLLHGTDVPFARPPEKRVRDIADAARAHFDAHMKVLDGRLAGREYLLGSEFTLVDVATGHVDRDGFLEHGGPPGSVGGGRMGRALPGLAPQVRQGSMAQAFGG